MTDSPAVLVFGREGEVLAFRTPKLAAAYLDVTDVRNGEYVAIFAVDGRVVTRRTAGDVVSLTVTPDQDDEGLRRHLREYVTGSRLASSPDDPAAVAEELIRWEWDHRWPRRPRWLDRLLHGKEPRGLRSRG